MKYFRSWLWLLLMVPLAFGIARLRFDVEILNLLPGKLSVAQGLKTYQKNFSNARELIITVQSASGEETRSAARSIAQVLNEKTNLVAAVTWQPGWLESPALATELVAALWLNQPTGVVAQLTNRLAPNNLSNVLAETREQLATSLSPDDIAWRGYDPYGLLRLPESVADATPSADGGEELFASQDGMFRILFVESRPDITSYRDCRDWIEKIQEILKQAQSSGAISPATTIRYTGRPPFVTEIAGGMEGDMIGSAGGTLVVIGILFWLAHRRIRPLLWLLLFLLIVLGVTTALGGLFLGTINVVSMGFASILLGLAEDFGIVIYQEVRSHPELNARELRRLVAPGIFWSTVTTSGAFLVLNLSTLPGIAQLGSLVAIGIVVAMLMMLYVYLPPLLRFRRKEDLKENHSTNEKFLLFAPKRLLPENVLWLFSIFLLSVSLLSLWRKGPEFDHSPNVLKPRNSDASAALEEIKVYFGRTEDPLWVLIPGKTEAQVERGLVEVAPMLSAALTNRLIASFTLPTTLWPNAENQRFNGPAISALLREEHLFREAALNSGFTTNSLLTLESIFSHWRRATEKTNVFWPTNEVSRWIYSKVVARSENEFLALGLIQPFNKDATKKLASQWPNELEQRGIILSGWELLGTTVFDTVMEEMPRLIFSIFILVFVSLWLAFRRMKEVLLSLLALTFTGLLLQGAMGVLGWEWNILNLVAVPLLLGMGVDFGIHMQLALRRYNGDRLAVRRSVGRALLLAGSTTVAGFASLSFSTNSGMASLGQVCALGIALALLVSVYLLPVWWKKWPAKKV